MSRLFGSVDTEEVRELKIIQLEQRIAQHDEVVKQVDEDLKWDNIYSFNFCFRKLKSNA